MKNDRKDDAENHAKKYNFEDLGNRVIDVAIKVAKINEGALFVIGNNSKYDLHFPNFFNKNAISVFDEGIDKVLVKLATIDGAVIIDDEGIIQAYGARILNTDTLKGFGTRHAAARGASLANDMVILVSEEDNLIRVFREGNIGLELKPQQ